MAGYFGTQMQQRRLADAVWRVAHDRRGVIRVDVERGLQVADRVAHGARPFDHHLLGGGDVVEIAHGRRGCRAVEPLASCLTIGTGGPWWFGEPRNDGRGILARQPL